MKDTDNINRRVESGYSMVELLVVLLIMSVLTVFALIYAYPHQKLYKPDDQSLLITDVLQEARQRSLTQNETLRVEISKTRGLVRLIEENSPATADDDVLRKQVALFAEAEVRYTEEPSDVDYNPPEPLEPADAVFQNSVYTGSIGEEVCTLRFLGNGTVTNAGNNSVGTGATPTGVTLQIWSPKKAPDETEFEILRAITVIGTTGVIRLWEFNPALERANKWQDSRRYGTYGTVSGATPTPTP